MGELSRNRTLILGIGNVLLSDEGSGVRAMEYFKSAHPDMKDTRFLDGGTLSFTLAADIEAATHLIVFDAAQFHDSAGTVKCLEGEAMDEFLSRGGRSVHEVGLIDLMDIARLAERLPKKRALIGIQPQKIDWGEALSPPVADSLPTAVEIAANLFQVWHGSEAT